MGGMSVAAQGVPWHFRDSLNSAQSAPSMNSASVTVTVRVLSTRNSAGAEGGEFRDDAIV
jgi:hypothetical protein